MRLPSGAVSRRLAVLGLAMARTRYRYDPANPPTNRIIIATRDGVGASTLYVPPIGDELPWTESFETYDEALNAAMSANNRLGNPSLILETRDQNDWWMSCLLDPVV